MGVQRWHMRVVINYDSIDKLTKINFKRVPSFYLLINIDNFVYKCLENDDCTKKVRRGVLWDTSRCAFSWPVFFSLSWTGNRRVYTGYVLSISSHHSAEARFDVIGGEYRVEFLFLSIQGINSKRFIRCIYKV